jgi:hypothetical protein
METNKSSWLSAHLYYNEPWEDFLLQGVKPFLETALKTGIVETYFFIRYWDRGPHIRLRLKGETSAIDQVLRPNLVEHFENYFEVYPSVRTEPEYPLGYPQELHWLPNNTIQLADYDSELDRYGGQIGLGLSEQQFRLSSDIVLYYLQQQANHSEYAEQLGIAIRLHLAFAFSLGMDRRTIAEFFNMIFENWLPRAIEVPVNEENRDFILQKMNETIGLFEDSFEKQRETLTIFHNELMRDLASDFEFEADIFNQWITENRRLGLELTQAAESNQLLERSETYVLSEELQKQCSDKEILLWNIWADYVHMTNNRLGIFNHDEAYLAYLIKRSLSQEG